MYSAHINTFLDYLKYEKKYSVHTVISYQNDIIQFFSFIQEHDELSQISEINYQHVRTWISELLQQKLSPKSVNRKLSTLKSFFKHLQRQQVIENNPMSKISGPKTPKRLPTFVDEQQMINLFENIKFSDDLNGLRDKLLLDLFYQTGMRRSELANLKESDVDLFNSSIKVLGKRNKERIIPISLELKRNLEAYFNVKQADKITGNSLFVNDKGNAITEQNVYTFVKRYLAQITSIQKKSPHVLRHTFATHLLNNGADINAVKDLLGHANLSATQVYTHNTIDKLKKSYKQAHPRGDD